MSSTVPNYVGAVDAPEHDPEHLGQAVPQNIAVRPKHIREGPNDDMLRSFTPLNAHMTPMECRESTFKMVQDFNDARDQMFRSQMELPDDFAPSFSEGIFDRPRDERMEAADPFEQYARNELAYSASYILDTRAPSF